MYNPENTKKLIVVNISQVLIDYTSIQCDIDESKIQSAELIAQMIDLKRLIGAENVTRCIDPVNRTGTIPIEDINLRELVLPVIAYFTYSRLLRMFPGTFTDSGYVIEKEASDRNVTTAVSNEYAGIAESFMDEVFTFLKAETKEDKKVQPDKLTPSIRVFGGQEFRASN